MEKLHLPPIIDDPKLLRFEHIQIPALLFSDDRFSWMTQNERILYAFYLNAAKFSYLKKQLDSQNRPILIIAKSVIAHKISTSENTVKNARIRLNDAGLISLVPGSEQTNNIPIVFVNNIFLLSNQELHVISYKENRTTKVKEEESLVQFSSQPDTTCENEGGKEDNKSCLSAAEDTKNAPDNICAAGSQNLSTSNSVPPLGNKSLFCSLLRVREDTAKKVEVIEEYFSNVEKKPFNAEDRLYCQTLVENKTTAGELRFLCHIIHDTLFRSGFRKDMEQRMFWIERKKLSSLSLFMKDCLENKRRNTIRSIRADAENKDFPSIDAKDAWIKAKIEHTPVDYIKRNTDILNALFTEAKSENDIVRLVRAVEFLTIQQPDLFWYLNIKLQNVVGPRMNDLTKKLILNCEFDIKKAYKYIEASDDTFAKMVLIAKRKAGKMEISSEKMFRKWAADEMNLSLVQYAFDIEDKEDLLTAVDKRFSHWKECRFAKVEEAVEYEENRKDKVKPIRNPKYGRYNNVPYHEKVYTEEHIKLMEIKSTISLLAIDTDDKHFEELWAEFCDAHEEVIKSSDWLRWMKNEAHKMDITNPESIKEFDQKWKEYCEKKSQAS